MIKVTEFLTVNIAVADMEEARGRYEAIGLAALAPAVWPEPPIQMTDVTMEFPLAHTAISLIEPWEGTGPVEKFISRRGEGVYSVAVRVDDLAAAMRDWAELGMEWVSDEPAEVPGARAASYVADRVLVNWVKPRTFGGVLLEVFELQGDVRLFKDQ